MPIAGRGQLLLALLAATAAEGCRGEQKAAPAPSAVPPAKAEVAPPLAGERIDVPAGAFKAGSAPGEPGRKPDVEQRIATVELGPYRIDRLPYPNDPASAPLLGATREEADRRCNERGLRLCTELEWERACRGPASHLFASGAEWQPSCGQNPNGCASGFDVLGMGARLEWTSSDVVPDADGPRKAAARGAPESALAAARRCAARTPLEPDARDDAIAFRCCKGPRNAARVVEPRAGATFERASITPARLAELLAADPKTARVAKDVKTFREPDAAETVVGRGPGDRKGFSFTVAPLRWNPVAGAEFLVATGRSGEKISFVVVFHVLGQDEYRLASSFVMENEVGPVALAYSPSIRPRLHFSTCWGCLGETGKILYRDPDAAVILQP